MDAAATCELKLDRFRAVIQRLRIECRRRGRGWEISGDDFAKVSSLLKGFDNLRKASARLGVDAIARVVAAKADHLKQGPTLEDLHGYGAARDWGLALSADLQAYRSGTLNWTEIDSRGLLLSGPPGVGKTSYVRALARTAKVPLVATSVAEWNSSDHLGGTLRTIREVFASARAKAPAILFIDEVDGISDCSKMRRRTRLHRHDASRLIGQERRKPSP